MLVRQGFGVAAWEEAAKGGNGGIGHGAVLFSWTGQGPGVEASNGAAGVVSRFSPAENERVEWVAVKAVPLFEIKSVDDVLKHMEEVRAAG